MASPDWRSSDVGREHVVALMLRNDPAFLISMLMCRLGGFYACPINWHFKADEAAYVLQDSGARVLIIHADLLKEIASALPAGLELIVVEPSPEIRRAFGIASDHANLRLACEHGHLGLR